MRDIRIYVDQALTADTQASLPATAAHHLVRVLRLRTGARIQVFNGDGQQFSAEIIEVEGQQNCRIHVGQAERPKIESVINVTLAQAIGRGDRMDWCIQKTTELGVARIQPLLTERTEVRLSGQRLQRRLAHWQSVAVAAAEQSGRVRIPVIESPVMLDDLLPGEGLNLVLHPGAARKAANLTASKPSHFTAVIGPEGGFSDGEITYIEQRGFLGCNLGQRILRTETAGPALLAMLQTRFGDWS